MHSGLYLMYSTCVQEVSLGPEEAVVCHVLLKRLNLYCLCGKLICQHLVKSCLIRRDDLYRVYVDSQQWRVQFT